MIDTLYKSFRHWSDAGPVYILSDLHFGNTDCKLMDENWISEEEQVYIINHCRRAKSLLALVATMQALP